MATTVNKVQFSLSVISFVCALYGLFHYLKTVEENACDMTYMFEYPEYIKIPLNYSSAAKFPRYNLFIYGEGKYAEDLSEQRFRGFPVLFIPGNAGSHRQVRSLASVALRISKSRQTTLHFNFFSIDFNEEISGLYGGTLNDQTEFVLECIKHIQTLYPAKKKLILIGHSMGGVIAKASFSLPAFDPLDISIILTLASPHEKPVVAMDSDIVALYEKLKQFWKYRLKAELKDIPIVSIGGGRRDTLVRSDLISNNFEHGSNLDIHTLTSAIPGVWLSTDHLAIVWCKQLVLAVCRSLFDLNSLEVNKATREQSVTENILKFHFISKSSGNHWHPSWAVPFQIFPTSAQWIEQRGNTWRFSRSKILTSIYILIPFLKNDNVVIIASGLMKGDWIYGCIQLSATNNTCFEGENLSNKGEIIPCRKANVERRMVNFKIEDLKQKGFSALVIYIAPVDSQIEILGESYLEADRIKHFKLPSVLERIFSFAPHRVFTISLIEQMVYYNITISSSAGIFQTVEFHLETRLCRAGSVVGQGLVKLHIPWNNEDSYYHIRTSLGGVTHIPAMVHSQPPAHTSPDVNLLFIFDPECSVVLTAKFPFYLMATQFVKFYGTYVIAYAVAFLLVVLGDQMQSFGAEGILLSVYEIFGKLSPFVILVIVPSILYYLLWFLGLSMTFLPKPDLLNSSFDFIYSLILRTLLHFIAGGIIIFIYFVTEASLRAISLVWKFFLYKDILKNTQMPMEKISKVRVQVSKLTLIGCSVIAALCIGVSSSLATVIASVYYFFKVASMYTCSRFEEDRRGSSVATRKWCFHILLVLLWFFVIILSCPGLVTWMKNFKFSLKLSRDVYLLPSVVMVVSMTVLWQLPTPIFYRYKYEFVGVLLKSIAMVATLYGISSVYRLLYMIAAAFASICIQQTCAYFRGFVYLKHD